MRFINLYKGQMSEQRCYDVLKRLMLKRIGTEEKAAIYFLLRNMALFARDENPPGNPIYDSKRINSEA